MLENIEALKRQLDKVEQQGIHSSAALAGTRENLDVRLACLEENIKNIAETIIEFLEEGGQEDHHQAVDYRSEHKSI